MKLLRFVSFVNEALSQKINESVHIQPKDCAGTRLMLFINISRINNISKQ